MENTENSKNPRLDMSADSAGLVADYAQESPSSFVWFVDADAPDLGTFYDQLKQNKDIYVGFLRDGGMLYFSHTPCENELQFKWAVQSLGADLREYTGAKVRTEMKDPYVYAPTSTPRHRINYLHHEMAYQPDVPEGLALFCMRAAPEGGESLIADSREWYRAIAANVRDEIEARGLLVQRVLVHRSGFQSWLTRNFDTASILPSWQGNFDTDDRDIAAAKARVLGYETTWHKNKHMVLRAQISPVRLHPKTGEKMWVNNAHLFQLHRQVFGRLRYWLFKTYFFLSRMPMTTIFFGDGARIPAAFTSEILRASVQVQKIVKMQEGDLALLNNHAIAHGRLPFKGPRRLLFAMIGHLKRGAA